MSAAFEHYEDLERAVEAAHDGEWIEARAGVVAAGDPDCWQIRTARQTYTGAWWVGSRVRFARLESSEDQLLREINRWMDPDQIVKVRRVEP